MTALHYHPRHVDQFASPCTTASGVSLACHLRRSIREAAGHDLTAFRAGGDGTERDWAAAHARWLSCERWCRDRSLASRVRTRVGPRRDRRPRLTHLPRPDGQWPDDASPLDGAP